MEKNYKTIMQDSLNCKNAEYKEIRVEETVFVSGSDYMEEGWVCTAIQYPRKPLKENVIKAFMLDLADYLLENLHQKRICIMDNKTVAMCVKSWTNE